MGKVAVDYIKGLIEVEDKKSRKKTAEKVLEEKKKQFDNYGANDWDDELFPPIKESTIKRKKGEDRPLLRTGKLRDSLYIPDDEDFTQIGSHDPVDEYGRPYLGRAKEFIRKHGGEHYFDELSEKEAHDAMYSYVITFIEGMKNGG